MDDGEIDFSDREMFTDATLVNDIPNAASMDSFLDDLLKNTHSCTHTHTCNPPGPDNTHTHTCFHTHTQLFASTEEENSVDTAENQSAPSSSSRKKRPVGNKEAVKKYREKKKAHTAFLEEQVNQLRALNQQLARRLRGQAALEAEVMRLRTLLSEFRGRIDAELGVYPHQKQPEIRIAGGDGSLQPLTGGYFLNTVTVPCDEDVPCLHSSMGKQKESTAHHEHTETVRSCGTCNAVDPANCMGIRSDNSGIRGGRNVNIEGTTSCAKGMLPV